MIRRYLGGFGPATVMDFQSWSGLTKMEKIFEVMRPGLRVYRTDEGVELFDLPEATLAEATCRLPSGSFRGTTMSSSDTPSAPGSLATRIASR
jgi:hypothetical protein